MSKMHFAGSKTISVGMIQLEMSSPYLAQTSQTNTPLDSPKYSFICDQNLKYSSAAPRSIWNGPRWYLSEILLVLSNLQEVLH